MGSLGLEEVVLILAVAVFYIGLFLGVVWGIRAVIRHEIKLRGAAPAETRESAAEILKKRYARGEITREQYQEMKQELGD